MSLGLAAVFVSEAMTSKCPVEAQTSLFNAFFCRGLTPAYCNEIVAIGKMIAREHPKADVIYGALMDDMARDAMELNRQSDKIARRNRKA